MRIANSKTQDKLCIPFVCLTIHDLLVPAPPQNNIPLVCLTENIYIFMYPTNYNLYVHMSHQGIAAKDRSKASPNGCESTSSMNLSFYCLITNEMCHSLTSLYCFVNCIASLNEKKKFLWTLRLLYSCTPLN